MAKEPLRESNPGPPAPEARIIGTRPKGLHANSNALPSTNTCEKHLYQLDILFNSNYMYF